MEKQTFIELWQTLTPFEKDAMSIALAKKCNVRVTTVPLWGKKIRTPKLQSQDIIVKYLKASRGIETDYQTLFPNQ